MDPFLCLYLYPMMSNGDGCVDGWLEAFFGAGIRLDSMACFLIDDELRSCSSMLPPSLQ